MIALGVAEASSALAVAIVVQPFELSVTVTVYVPDWLTIRLSPVPDAPGPDQE